MANIPCRYARCRVGDDGRRVRSLVDGPRLIASMSCEATQKMYNARRTAQVRPKIQEVLPRPRTRNDMQARVNGTIGWQVKSISARTRP